MEARVKTTGEIVTIMKNIGYPGGYVASNGRTYHDEDLILIVNEDPDYWTRLEHQYAGMAMQGLLANHYITDRIDVSVLITEAASSIAHTLVEKLKEKEE